MSSTSVIPHRSYRYGETSWNDQLHSIQLAIVDAGRAQVSAVRESADTIAAGLDDLRTQLHWGFTLLHDQLDDQRRLFETISEHIRKIEAAITTPDQTHAREAFTLGRKHIRQGLLVKGLEALAKAEQLHDVDFLLQLQIGKLRLYGRNHDDDVVDLNAAEKHLLLAHRYGCAARVDLQEKVDLFVADACYHLAVLKYVRSSDRFREGDRGSAEGLLKDAVEHLEASPAPAAQHQYFEARCLCLVGETRTAYRMLARLCDSDRRFAIVAAEEPDFAALAEDLRDIPKLLRAQPGPLTTTAFAARDAAFRVIEQAREADPHAKVQSALNDLGDRLRAADRLLDSGGIDAATLAREAENTSSAAVEHGTRAYDERLTRLWGIQNELRSVGTEAPESPLRYGRFLFLLLPTGIGASIVTLFLELFGWEEAARAWAWWIMTLSTTALITLGLQVVYVRDKRKFEAIQAEKARIRETTANLEAARRNLEKLVP